MNGYDIDGVLVPLCLEPSVPFVVISGRTHDAWDADCEALARHAPVYINPDRTGAGDWVKAAAWKAKLITAAGVTTFYEDDPNQARRIRELCPDTDVVLVARLP